MRKGRPGGLLVPGLLMLFLGLFAVIMGFGFVKFFGGAALAIVIFGLLALGTGVVLVVMFYRGAAEERRAAGEKPAEAAGGGKPAETAEGAKPAAAAEEDPFGGERTAVVRRKIRPWEYPPAPKYCPWCGAGMFADYMYCPKCGKEL